MTIKTIRNISRCFTIRRFVNLIKIFLSFKISAWSHKNVVWGKPYSLTIEPTNICNLKCPECPSGTGELTRPLGSMDINSFRDIIDEVHKDTFYLHLFFQGEPFINKHLIEMIEYARWKKMYVSISTNAHFIQNGMAKKIVDAHLDRLIISLDGVTEESYKEYRIGGKFSKVIEALENIQSENAEVSHSSTELFLQFLITKQNEHELKQLQTLSNKYHAEIALKTMQVYSIESANYFLPSNEKYRRYNISNGEIQMKSKMKNRCSRLWDRSVITWDGKVVPCCFDKDATHELGDVNKNSIDQIWKSETYNSFRNKILQNRKGVDMCTNCTEGLKVYR